MTSTVSSAGPTVKKRDNGDDGNNADVASVGVAIPAGTMEVVNVCSGQLVTIGHIAGPLTDAYGPSAPRPVITGHWGAGDVRQVVASPVKARALLGFTASTDITAGLAETAQEPSEFDCGSGTGN
jgi:dTDP-L-rhamnose 4-epimerase